MNDLESLIRFLDGELNEEEKKELQKQLLEDPKLMEQYQLIVDFDKAMNDKQLKQFEDSLDRAKANYFESLPEAETLNPPFRKIRHWLIAASIIFAVILGIVLSKTLIKGQNTDQLFAQYYERLDNSFTSRSYAESGNDFTKAIQFYDQGNYEGAIMLLKRVVTVDPANNAAKLFLGISFIETEQLKNAIPVFKNILESNDVIFGEHARWYLSLCYIKLKEVDKAKQQLQQIIKEKTIYAQKASEILKKIS